VLGLATVPAGMATGANGLRNSGRSRRAIHPPDPRLKAASLLAGDEAYPRSAPDRDPNEPR